MRAMINGYSTETGHPFISFILCLFSETVYPTQTCEEAIKFTADMKFGRDHQGERARVVRACLNVVGLDAETFASRKIGGELAGGVMIRGLSGGERKRLAMACALALKPKMLFIDELTRYDKVFFIYLYSLSIAMEMQNISSSTSCSLYICDD